MIRVNSSVLSYHRRRIPITHMNGCSIRIPHNNNNNNNNNPLSKRIESCGTSFQQFSCCYLYESKYNFSTLNHKDDIRKMKGYYDSNENDESLFMSNRARFNQIPINPSILNYIESIGVGLRPMRKKSKLHTKMKSRRRNNNNEQHNFLHEEDESSFFANDKRRFGKTKKPNSHNTTNNRDGKRSSTSAWLPPPPFSSSRKGTFLFQLIF